MIFTNLKRIIKTGFVDFWRNGFVSLASILVFTVTLFIIGSLILGGVVLDSALNQIRSQVDINVYMTLEAPENEILILRDRVADLPEVQEAIYISREEVLVQFKEKYADNYTVLQSIEVLDDNPLPAEINIRSDDPSQYEGIARFLDSETIVSGGSGGIIEKINYHDNKNAIDKLANLIDSLDRAGLYLTIIFIFIAVAVAFNTIKLVIFTSREEISVMRLVGASDSYIRGPFIIEGAMYGIAATVITLLLLYPITKWASLATDNFYGAMDLAAYYLDNILRIGLVLLISGVFLGMFSSFLAVKKYLNV